MRSPVYRRAAVEANIANRLALQIRLLREQRGWSQQQLAQQLGTQQSAIARLENPTYGNHSLSMLKKVAAVFDVSIWVEFTSFSTHLRRKVDLSPRALTARAYGDEFDADGNPRASVGLYFDDSCISHNHYISMSALPASASLTPRIENLSAFNTTSPGKRHEPTLLAR